MLNRIWAPWRAHYVQSASASPQPDRECFLCRGLASDQDRQNLVVERRTNSFVILNRYPYNNGHLLVAPRVHRGTLGELEGPDLLEPIETIRRMIAILDRMLQPQGYNIGLNQGKRPVPVCRDICTGISFRGGTETRISCPFWGRPRSSSKVCTNSTTDFWRNWVATKRDPHASRTSVGCSVSDPTRS